MRDDLAPIHAKVGSLAFEWFGCAIKNVDTLIIIVMFVLPLCRDENGGKPRMIDKKKKHGSLTYHRELFSSIVYVMVMMDETNSTHSCGYGTRHGVPHSNYFDFFK